MKKEWEDEARERSKLEVMRGLLAIALDSKARCVDVNCKSPRRILANLMGEPAPLRMETGRWGGLKREDRLCKQCKLEEVEDEEHFMLRCEGWTQEREVVTKSMERLVRELVQQLMTGRWP